MIKYCPRCHREAYRLIEEDDQIKIKQGNSTIISVNESSNVSMSVNCPNGHSVKLKIGGPNGSKED